MMERHKRVLPKLRKLNPEALLLEPRDVYDSALVDLTDAPSDHWPREGKTWVAVYGVGECLEAIRGWLGGSREDAQDWFDFNTSGAWMGDGTPTFRWEEE